MTGTTAAARENFKHRSMRKTQAYKHLGYNECYCKEISESELRLL